MKNSRRFSSHSAQDSSFRLDPFRQPSRDLGGADARRATRWRDRRTTARRALSVSQWVHLSFPPGGVTRSRDHWVRLDSRALAYVRSIDRSVGRLVAVATKYGKILGRSRRSQSQLRADKRTHHDRHSLVDISFAFYRDTNCPRILY